MQKPRRLKEGHWLFVKEFVTTGDRRSAVMKSGYAGTDPQLMSVRASQLLNREDIKDAILKYTDYLADPDAYKAEPDPVKPPSGVTSDRQYLKTLKTREDRLEWLAMVVTGNTNNKDDDPPPWPVRMNAFKMLGEMNGDFLVRNLEPPKATVQQIFITDGDARDVLSGKKTAEEVISARNGSGNRLGGGSGDVIDVILDDDSDAP